MSMANAIGPARSPTVLETPSPCSAKADAHWLTACSDAPAQSIIRKNTQKSFFRNLVALLFALAMLLREHGCFLPKKGSLPFLVLRATAGTLGILCNFYAIDHLALSDASILNKMSPFFAILCSWIFLREKLNWKQGLIVLGAFVGALCVIKPTFANADLFPSLIGLLGGFGAGVAYTMVRRLGQIGENKAYIVFFFSAFSCVVTLPYLLFCYEPMTWKQLLCLVMAGRQADSSVSLLRTAMHRQRKFPFTITPRSFLPQAWDFCCLHRFPTG